MKIVHLLAVTVLLSSLTSVSAQTPPPVTPQTVGALRGVAQEAERNCTFLYDNARKLRVRNSQQGKALAATLRLRDTARKYADATVSERWPRPDWLRTCSENLLNAWIDVEQSFPMFEATPPVIDWWNRAQGSLVALYNAAAPIMGRPAGGPLPAALAGGAPIPPGPVRDTVPVVPGGAPVVK